MKEMGTRKLHKLKSPIKSKNPIHEETLCSSWAPGEDGLIPCDIHNHPLSRSEGSSTKLLSITESKKRMQEKQLKAAETRERLLEEKSNRYKEKQKKQEDIRRDKEEKEKLKKEEITMKLAKAEELRNQQITKIIRTAHEEEVKVDEILFINKIEAQNKRHDVMTKEKEMEWRIQRDQEERIRKIKEDNERKEAAAEERKRILQVEHLAKIQEIRTKIREKEEKVEMSLSSKERERVELLKEREKRREEKMTLIVTQQRDAQESLQRKIQQKQRDHEKRKNDNMSQIRQKAFELSVRSYSSESPFDPTPRAVPYEVMKMCSVCNVLIGSEIYLYSHLRGKLHLASMKETFGGMDVTLEEIEIYNIKHIIDAPPDRNCKDLINPELAGLDKKRLKSIKKRCSPLRQRMLSKGTLFQESYGKKKKGPGPNSEIKGKIMKAAKELKSLVVTLEKGTEVNVTNVDRLLMGTEKLLVTGSNERLLFAHLGGLSAIISIIRLVHEHSLKHTFLLFGDKVIVRFIKVLMISCFKVPDNNCFIFHSNGVTTLLDFLEHRLTSLLSLQNNSSHGFSSNQMSSNNLGVPFPAGRKYDPIVGRLNKLLGNILNVASTNPQYNEDTDERIHDVISYTVSIGIVDKVSLCITNAQGPLDNEPDLALFLMDTLSFLTSLTSLLVPSRRKHGLLNGNKPEDATQLTITMRMTQIAGVVPLVYGILLHSQVFSKGHSADVIPPESSESALQITDICLSLLNFTALVDLEMFQATLGSEGLSLQVRHITSYLLWYCCHWKQHKNLQQKVILFLGYFTLLHPDNQTVVHSGQRPTILEQMCSLPFDYFSDPTLIAILFPTLISCCFLNLKNRRILGQEMSPLMLKTFIEEMELKQLKGSTEQRGSLTTPYDSPSDSDPWTFALRFPRDLWEEAVTFFADETLDDGYIDMSLIGASIQHSPAKCIE